MRGKALVQSRMNEYSGITPAYAGKSPVLLVEVASVEDHPRVCGEKESTEDYYAEQGGSPPRMRGKVVTGIAHFFFPGITPAYAGKSSCTSWTISRYRDHPRVCGEKNDNCSRR